MSQKDYYQILGVDSKASQAEIKKAFHRLAKQYHPDKNKSVDAEKKFKDFNEAYQVLSNKDKRQKYDQYRKYGGSPFGGWQSQGGQGGGGRQVDFGGFGGGDIDFEDLFSSFFGGTTRRSRKKQPQNGSNINAQLEIDFETSITGGNIPFKISRQAECSICNGTGSADGKRKTCPQCHGAGVVQDIHGGFAMNKTCPACGGRGHMIDKPCKSCAGRGSTYKSQIIEVAIPKGISDKQVIRLANLGNAGEQGARAGDLLIEVKIRQHNVFTREGRDIYSDVTIDMVDAILGTKINVQTISGNVELNIPAGTQPNTKMRLKGAGVETRTGKGNHIITVKVKIPTNINKKQRDLLMQFKSAK